MKNLVACLVLCPLLHASVSAEELKTDKMNAQDMLKTRLDAVIRVLANSELEVEEKDKEILKIVTPIFDFRLMAFLTLGRPQWNALTKPEQEKFVEAFIKHLKNSYRDKITLYSDQKIVFKPTVIKGKVRVQVPTELISQESSLSILYLLWKKTNQPWKVYDVEVQGVSIITTYQSQFKEALQKGTVNDLLIQLEEAVKEKPTQ